MGARTPSPGDKPTSRPAIFRISPAETASSDKSLRAARICHVLTVAERGDPGLAVLAYGQLGVAHRRQILALGIGSGPVAHRVRRGRLHRIFASVFAVGHAALPQWGAEVAALLSVGDDAVLSGRAAAVVWGMVKPSSTGLEVTVIGRHVRHQPGLRVHRVAALDLRDVRLRHGLPVAAPARTLIDFAADANDDQLAGALAEARVLRLVTDRELTGAMERAPWRAGVARLRRLRQTEGGRQRTRNDAERKLLALIVSAGLPPPVANVRVCGLEVDLLWPAERVIVEFDGWDAHGHHAAFERDHRRGQVLGAAGYRVLRVTWRQLIDEPIAVVVSIAQTLART
jgi:very-short-patch-repair endonuclease